MTDLTSFNKTDYVDDMTAALYNALLANSLQARLTRSISLGGGTQVLYDIDLPIQEIVLTSAGLTILLPPEANTNHVFILKNTNGSGYTFALKNNSGVTLLATVAAGNTVMAVPVGGVSWAVIVSGIPGLQLANLGGGAENVGDGTNTDGTATTAARSDHKHAINSYVSGATPSSILIGASGSPGAASAASHADHTHPFPTPAGVMVKEFVFQVVAIATQVDTTSGLYYFRVPSSCNGRNLTRAQAYVNTAGTTNATTIQVRNMTKYSGQDSLSTAISIASGGLVGSPGTINQSYDDVSTDDLIKVYVTAQSTTKPLGLMVSLEFQ